MLCVDYHKISLQKKSMKSTCANKHNVYCLTSYYYYLSSTLVFVFKNVDDIQIVILWKKKMKKKALKEKFSEHLLLK